MFKEKTYRVLARKRTLERLHRFISNLLRKAFYFEKVFDGYLGISFEALAEQGEYQLWNLDQLKAIMANKRHRGDFDQVRQVVKTH